MPRSELWLMVALQGPRNGGHGAEHEDERIGSDAGMEIKHGRRLNHGMEVVLVVGWWAQYAPCENCRAAREVWGRAGRRKREIEMGESVIKWMRCYKVAKTPSLCVE